MATYSYLDIRRDVRIILDENEDNTPLLEDLEPVTLQTEQMMAEAVLQSIDEVFSQAQLYLLKDAVKTSTVKLNELIVSKSFMMPEDFLRYVSVYCSDWPMPVYDPIDQDSDEYQMQFSPCKGVRGNTERPVVAVIPLFGGALGVQIFSTNAEDCKFSYVPKAQTKDNLFAILSNEEEFEWPIPDLLYKAVCYTVAKYYLTSVGDTEKAGQFAAIASGMMGITAEATQ